MAGHFPYANLIDEKWRADGSAASIEAQIRLGHDPMPKFEGKLTEEEIRQTVAYVEAMTRKAAQGRRRRRTRGPMSRRIPLFPLPGVVLLPGTILPLHIFEARYRAMVADALEGDRTIGMAMLKPGAEGPEPPRIHAVGGAGEIIESEQLEDGRYNILLEGRFRYRVLEEARPDPYRVARVEEIRSVPFPQPEERDRVLPGGRLPLHRDRRPARSAPASGRGARARTAGLGAGDPPALHTGRAPGASRDRLAAGPVRDAHRQDAGMERTPALAGAVPAEGSGPADGTDLRDALRRAPRKSS